MLSRTADHLFWMARYIERAENTARVLDVAYRSALLPDEGDSAERQLWHEPLDITGSTADYLTRYPLVEKHAVTRYITLDPGNPSSIHSCLMLARENARSVRGAITSEMWESINLTWLEFSRLKQSPPHDCETCLFDWVRERSHLFRGVTLGTILKDDALRFIRLGTFVERADNTARILDVKYRLLQPQTERDGQADYYQWSALLRSVSAFEAYRKIYRDIIRPDRVAELLILRADMPRSLHACLNEIEAELDNIHASETESRRRAGALHAALHYERIEDVLSMGLRDYLTHFLDRTQRLGDAIRNDFLARRDSFVSAATPPQMAQVQ